MEHEHADRASPEQRRQAGRDGPSDGHAEAERDREPEERPEDEGPVDESNDRIGEEIRREPLLLSATAETALNDDPDRRRRADQCADNHARAAR